jgi:thermostable 8-oxoguanine DNA glycosylase
MQTKMVARKPVTTIRPESKRKLHYVIAKLGPHTTTPELGRWKSLSDEELWRHIVSQVCVMGSALQMERLEREGRRPAFDAALSLSTLSAKQARIPYIAGQLKNFGVTRFYNKAAQRLESALGNSKIVLNSRVVLLENLPAGEPDAVREALLARSPSLFLRKSVSDLMITVGLSHDVIALDQRVVGLLNAHLGYNRKFDRLQSSQALYLSVEHCLREVCKEANVTLATLDRMLFNFAGLTAIEYLMGIDLPKHASGEQV